MKVTINVDGGSRGNPGPGASAYVIRDAAGKILRQEGIFIGICTNNEAEFKALLYAFEAAAKLGAKDLRIFADSELLVKQFLGEYKVKSPKLVPIMAQLRLKARKFASVTITHVPREKNKEADKLANQAMDKAVKPAIARMKAEAGFPPSKKKAAPAEPEQLKLFEDF